MTEARQRYPEQDALVSMERFEQFAPRMLAGVAAPARAADLVPIVREWKPDLLVHDVRPSHAVQFCNTTPVNSPFEAGPATPYPSPIVVSGLTGTVTDVNVRSSG